MESKIAHVSPYDAEALRRLAQDVIDALSRAGLNAWSEDDVRNPAGGAQVFVDTVDDKSGGVLVTWDCEEGLSVFVEGAMEERNVEHPDVIFLAGVFTIMGTAIKEILKRAGFDVVDAPDTSGALALVRLTRQ